MEEFCEKCDEKDLVSLGEFTTNIDDLGTDYLIFKQCKKCKKLHIDRDSNICGW